MMFVAALIIAVTLLMIGLALRRPDVLKDRYHVEVAHHRALLARIEADCASAGLSHSDAQALTLDVQRRLLRARRSAAESANSAVPQALPLGFAVIAVALGVICYAQLGHHALRDAPAAPMIVPTAVQHDSEAAQQLLIQNPANIAAWIDFSMALQRQGMSGRAVEALAKASETMPDSADLWVARGQALMQHGGGQLSPAARLAFNRASALDPSHPGPRLYLALAWLQAGQPDQALPILEELAQSSPADAPWMPRVAAMTRGAKAMIAAGVGSNLPPR